MVKEIAVFEFKNEKQNLVYDTVMQCIARVPGFAFRYFFMGGAIRGGKLLPLNTPIPTPEGWTTMGALQENDVVIDCEGKPTKVVWCSEVNNEPEAWKLIFDDGSHAICDIGHQWVTLTRKERIRLLRSSEQFRAHRRANRPLRGTGQKPELAERNRSRAGLIAEVPNYRGNTRSTEEIINTLYDGKFANHVIVNCAPLDLPEKKLPLQPYTFGAWLGDGTRSCGGLTGIDSEVWEEIEKEGYTVSHHKEAKSHTILNIIGTLRKMNVLNNKHIPIEYLRGSIEQRLALLQGLCDTDGHCTADKGSIEFTTTSQLLKDGFLELLYSLGIKPSCREGKATLKGRYIGVKWRIQFWFDKPCFRIKRKLERQKFSKGKTRNYRIIVGAVKVKSVPMRCIAVDAPTKTYLCGKGMVPTHNTFVCLFILWVLAKMFPGSRWYVIREDNPALESTAIPSMEKLIGKYGNDFRWIRKAGSVQVVFENGSRIFFKSENLIKDPELKEFLGLEMNGVLLEQMEALSEKLFTRVRERIGTWYIDPMPIPILLGTFNPSPVWIKKVIYDAYMKNDLPAAWFYVPALPNDNPFVTLDQWENWGTLDPESQNVMIKGIWSFKLDGNIWAYAFREEFHVVDKADPTMQLNRLLPVYLIFDFNVDPMTCLVAQKEGLKWGRIIKEYRLRNSDIFEMTERIKIDLISEGYYVIATGDASGRNRAGQTRGAKSYVDIIRLELKLSDRQMQFPTDNPSVKNTRVVVNSLLHNHKDFKISSACLWLIDDLNTVKTDSEGEIDKKKIDKTKTHLLDNLRYFSWNYFRAFVKVNF